MGNVGFILRATRTAGLMVGLGCPLLAQNAAAPRMQASTAAQAPVIVLTGGLLKVTAQNADLPQILAAVAKLGGMKLEGSVQSSRVYGVFGPNTPKAVLKDLLEGTGYNYLMVGSTEQGLPRILRLSPQTGAASPPGASPSQPAEEPEEPGPGAIVHVPPPPAPTAEERSQKNLKRLQQMHESEKQQSPQ